MTTSERVGRQVTRSHLKLDLAISAGGSIAAAAVGGLGARHAPEVYRLLEKPTWAPPSTVFGPVWSALYTGMGVAAWRLSGRTDTRSVLVLHGLQLVLNGYWPIAFFARRSKRESLAVIAVLDALVATETVSAWRRDRLSGALLTPYLGWSLFATALNAAVRWPEGQTAPAA